MSAPESQKTFVPYHPFNRCGTLLVIALSVLALMVLRLDLVLTLTSRLIGGFSGDGGLYLWLFRHNASYLLSEPWFNTNASYPYSETLAWSDNFIFPSLVGRLFLSAGIGELLSYNLLLLLAMLLNGICTTRFCFHLTGKLEGSLFAGILFMGSSYLSSVVGHPQLQFAFWIPLATDLFFRFLNTRSPFHSFLLGGCITLTFLTTVYYSLFIVLLCLALSFGLLLLRPKAFGFGDLIRLASPGAIGCLPLLFFSAPYLDVQATFGERHLYEPYYFSASLLSYFSSPSSSVLYSWTSSWAEEEAHLFCGLLPLILIVPLLKHLAGTASLKKIGSFSLFSFVLAGIASSFGRHRAAEIATLLFSWSSIFSSAYFLWKLGELERRLGATYITLRSLAALFFFLLILFFSVSLGPLGNPALNTSALGPFRLFYEAIPGFDSIRAVSRTGLLCLFSIGILTALAIQFLYRSRTVSVSWLAIGYFFVISENLNFPHPAETLPPAPSAVNLIAARRQPNEVTAFLPFSGPLKETGEIDSWKTFAKIQVSAMNWALDGDLQTINGYSGQQTKIMRELPRELAGFPSERAILALRQFAGLTHIIYLPSFAKNFDQKEFELRMRYFKDQLLLREVDQSGNYLFELTGEHSLEKLPALLVPAFPPRVVSLQLKTSTPDKGGSKTLPVFIHGQSENTPVFTLTITADGEFHWYTLTLPLIHDLVRPVRLLFKGEDRKALVLGKVLVSAGGGS